LLQEIHVETVAKKQPPQTFRKMNHQDFCVNLSLGLRHKIKEAFKEN